VYSAKHPFDDSDAVLELSPSLRLVQYFAPADWAVNDSDDLDMSIEPVLLPDGQVVLTGKNTIVFLLNGKHLGGIGKQQAKLGPVCTTNIDGGSADAGMTVYLPCLNGIVAVTAASSPPALHLKWSSSAGGGPPIVAGGLVWTITQSGHLYGLDPATGKIRQEAAIGTPANHFPTPGIGDGLLLAPSAQNVIAFRTSTAAGITSSAARVDRAAASSGPGTSAPVIAGIAAGCLAAVGAIGWLAWLARKRRRT
jgi:PQQ-like domain